MNIYKEAILLLYTYMHINSDGSVRACVYRCVYTYTYAQYIFIYIYKTEYVWCTESQKGRAARPCCVKCRCCSLKKKRKNTETPRLLLNREWRDFGTQISDDYEERKQEHNRISTTVTVAKKEKKKQEEGNGGFNNSRYSFRVYA